MILRFVLVAAVALVVAGSATPAEGPTRTVLMPGKLYDPARLDVLVGTTVAWRNDDSTNHTATADGDAFASGYIPPGGSFSFTFTRQGRYVFHCTIHKQMRGEVNVFGLVLAGPEGPVTAGRRIVLAGLAPPGTASVTLRGTQPERTVKPREDGSFALRLAVAGPGSYRAVAGALASPRVPVSVKPIVHVAVLGRILRVTTTPRRPGAVIHLQEYDRERFAWRVAGRAVLDARSRASLRVPAGARRVRAMVLGSQGWADAASPALVLRASS